MKRDQDESGPEMTACRNPPSIIAGPHIVRGLKFNSKRIQITSITLIILLILTPLFVGAYFIYLNPPRGLVEIYSGEDTFVSTSDLEEHSQKPFIRVSNYTHADDEIVEIGLYKFIYIPPPGGGRLLEATLSFHCDVITPGEIEFHIVDSDGTWNLSETDLTNLTYSSIPPYLSIPVASLTVNSNRTYSVSIFDPERLELAPLPGIIGIAVTAKHDTRIVMDSFEGLEESHRPNLTMVMGIGILIMNPFVYYLNPFYALPMLAGILIVLSIYWKMKQPRDD
ncbi:MAG: hypothetical protein RTU92_03455 [Candidatus Thorarchaeota archaeon]